MNITLRATLAAALLALPLAAPARGAPADVRVATPRAADAGGMRPSPAVLARVASAQRAGLRTFRDRARIDPRAVSLAGFTDCSAAYDGPFLCGSIQVPTIRGDATAGTRTIDMVYRRADVQPAKAVSLISDGPWISTFSAEEPWKAGLMWWTATAQGAEAATRDVLEVNVRSTGRDAIACPLLDTAGNPLVAAVAECAGILGRTADYFTFGDAARDLEAARRAVLGATRRVDLFAIGHAAGLAQAYLFRYPDRVRSAILDPAVRPDPWAAQDVRENTAIVGRICRTSARCSARISHPDRQVAWLAARVRRAPITGWTRLPDGTRWHVTLDERAVALGFLFNEPFTFARQAGLPAAIASYRRGDAAPLLRLAANVGIGDPGAPGPPLTDPGGPPSTWSYAGILASSCGEPGREPWDSSTALAERRAQALRRFAGTPADLYGIFSKAVFPGFDEDCMRWPVPARTSPIRPPHAPYPNVPVLVLAGELNWHHSMTVARQVAARYPRGSFVRVPRAGRASLWNSTCAARLAQHFLATRRVGDRRCGATEGGAVLGSGVFPRAAGGETPAKPAAAADASTLLDRKVAAATVDTVLDAIAQAFDAGAESGPALRGGRWALTNGPDASVWHLDGARFVRDVAVTGDFTFSFTGANPPATLAVRGPGGSAGSLTVDAPAVFSLEQPTAHVTGVLDARTIDVTVPLH